jgi:hypothetical protein
VRGPHPAPGSICFAFLSVPRDSRHAASGGLLSCVHLFVFLHSESTRGSRRAAWGGSLASVHLSVFLHSESTSLSLWLHAEACFVAGLLVSVHLGFFCKCGGCMMLLLNVSICWGCDRVWPFGSAWRAPGRGELVDDSAAGVDISAHAALFFQAGRPRPLGICHWRRAVNGVGSFLVGAIC